MFPIKLEFNIQNSEQLAAVNRVFAALAADGSEVGHVDVKTTPKTTAKADAPKQEKPVEKTTPSTGTTSDSEKSGAPSGTGASTGDTGGKVYTLDDAKTMTTGAVKNNKRTEMVALLAEFGVKQAALLKEDQVQAFCEKAAELQA